MVQAQLNGFLPPDFAGPLPTIDLRSPPPPPPTRYPPIDIADGRTLQSGATSEAAFFEKTGFVLLDHCTSVKDWDNVPPTFAEEIETIIRTRLLPGRRVEVQQRPSPMRRGRATDT